MVETIHGVLLGTTKYKDDTLIADLFTLEAGRLSLSARIGGTGNGNRLRRTLAQAPAVLEIEADLRPHGHGRMRQAVQSVLYSTLPYDPMKRAVAMYVARFAAKALMGEGTNPALYDYLVQSLRWLDTNPRPEATANFHIMVLMGMTTRMGIGPRLEGYEAGCHFDLSEAEFVSAETATPHTLDSRQAALLHLLGTHMGPRTLHLFRLTRSQRAECLQALTTYYALHVPGFKAEALPAEAVLRELFD